MSAPGPDRLAACTVLGVLPAASAASALAMWGLAGLGSWVAAFAGGGYAGWTAKNVLGSRGCP